jgi:hypothetical protein
MLTLDSADGNPEQDLVKRMMLTALIEGEDALEADEELFGELFGGFAQCPEVAGL